MKRKSNIELLRIICIVMILLFHAVYKNNYVYQNNLQGIIIKSFFFLGELGTTIFFLIFGYFNINSEFKLKKVIKLISLVLFYHYINLFICLKLNIIENITKAEMIELVLIKPFKLYWFITVYIIIYIISPYINKLIKNLTKSELENLIAIQIIIFSIIPTITGFLYNNSESMVNYNRLIFFIIIYIIGAYHRIYKQKADIKKEILKSFITFNIMVLSIVIIYYNNQFFKNIGTTELAYFWRPNNLFMIILSISIFKIFIKIDLPENKIINLVASTTLGIYLIHDGLLQEKIWNLFELSSKINTNKGLIYIFISVFIVFTVSFTIELIRSMISKKIIDKITNKYYIHKVFNSKQCYDILEKVIRWIK